MQNKPANRWLDIQIVIATLALTFSLALWNLFAGGSRVDNSGTVVVQAQEAVTSPASLSQPFSRILLGGSPPQTQVRQAPASSSSGAPSPVTITRSSRP